MKEVEPQWWILAAIDLTQLPSGSTSSSGTKSASIGKDSKSSGTTAGSNVEISSREVAPAHLLLAQLARAYRGFLLHHASSLSEMWKKHENNRELFCSLLQRFWTRFVWNWDVLLHGNPAGELYDAVKLAGGGELGIGVGEEEWGSGEREVLEGFAGRTEGLVDLLVGRYGDIPMTRLEGNPNKETKAANISEIPDPWLGNGETPRAQDGIVFSGIGGISKHSLITISQWMESIYMYGEAAYGIGENPASRPRNRRKRRKIDHGSSQDSRSQQTKQRGEEVHPRIKSPVGKAPDLRRRAIENSATPPGIPPPLVSAVEQSLIEATAKLSAKLPPTEDGVGLESTGEPDRKEQDQSSMFGTEKMMKYLSLGYGSSWTLNPKGFVTERSSQIFHGKDAEHHEDMDPSGNRSMEEHLQELDPTPEVSDEEEAPYVQRLEQSIGKFLIGLSGDLENTEFEDQSNDETTRKRLDILGENTESAKALPSSNRIFLRTLLVKMSTTRLYPVAATGSPPTQQATSDCEAGSSRGKTSAGASVDGPQPIVTHEKVQVAVYVHQPFIFVFLFQLRTPNLTMPAFYRAIHHTLGPLQKSLLRSTDPERWRERMKETLGLGSDSGLGEKGQATVSESNEFSAIYDLIYDPDKSTVRTSIPNIPLPGSLAAEGLHQTQHQSRPITVSGSWYTLGIPIGSSSTESYPSSTTLVKSDWTRIEALNVHTHLLHTWAATRDKKAGVLYARPGEEELERTVKTSRGWWVVWMRVVGKKGNPQSQDAQSSSCDNEKPPPAKEAILVRRSPQERTTSGRGTPQSRSDSRSASSSAGRWLLRDQPRSREVGGSGRGLSSGNGAGPGVTTAKGVTEGVGVDAKKWVEGLIRLSQ